MSTVASRLHHPAMTPIIHWTFRRAAETLTCAVDVTDDREYAVCVVPHWDQDLALIERFEAPISALERHAEIAHRLREAGWAVTAHTAAA